MLIIRHAVNTTEQLRAVPEWCGIEVDVRAFEKDLILHHEPFVAGELFSDFLDNFNHAFIILNIKCEGIEGRVIEQVTNRGIQEYFLLDVTPPFILKLIDQGVRKIAARFSEFESIDTCLNLKDRIDWVFIDNITHLPTESNSFQKLRKHFRLCIVSPELLNRDEIELTKGLLKSNPVDAVLTNEIEKWAVS